MRRVLPYIIAILSFACQSKKKQPDTLFTTVPAQESGIDFKNIIEETENLHYYDYMHLYNGAGVATVDLDNDGLLDVVFTANLSGCKVYRNLGNLRFEDVTEQSGIGAVKGFVTGISVGDVNADGRADLYISRSGWFKEKAITRNLLFVNQGGFTFQEEAQNYGIDDEGHSIHAVFFDYDKDGLLDLYVVNTPVDFSLVGRVFDLEDIKTNPYTLTFGSTDHLYKNNGNNTFTDVTQEAGLFNEIGFGLNAQVSDLNGDGWLDIFVSNDFISPDLVFINQQNGTFTEASKKLFGHISYNSMGADIADINNDGWVDIVVADMSPANYKRSKTTMAMVDPKRFDKMVKSNYHRQYMHNMLQLNNGDGTFSEISQLAGIDKTDWSWAPLLADFDNDGYKDLFVTNGVLRDVQDRDTDIKVKQMIDAKKQQGKLSREDFLKFSQMLPSVPLSNYAFKNKGDLTFEKKIKEWGFEEKTFSTGGAYADLDNDGDLDLVVNNINNEASVYQNNAQSIGNSLTISLRGPAGNPWAIGSRVKVWLAGQAQVSEVMLSRGYMSSVDSRLHFGLGKQTHPDSIVVTWPDGKQSRHTPDGDSMFLTLSHSEAQLSRPKPTEPHQSAVTRVIHRHREIPYDDFSRQVLLPHKLSQLGPALAVADVNGDGLDDIFVGGAHQFESVLYTQTTGGTFQLSRQPAIEEDKAEEDISAAFFDADHDGDMDLIVGAGSYEFDYSATGNRDRLYLNDGKGNFTKANNWPDYQTVSSVVLPFDMDQDGDMDVFIGNRLTPNRYPELPSSVLLENTPAGFVITEKQNHLLDQLGMVTDAKAIDYQQDGDIDLVLAGEWMPITLLLNDGTGLQSKKEIEGTSGWWNRLAIADVDSDGKSDIIAGNLGLNYKHHATRDKPFHILGGDFDRNGRYDMMLAKHVDNSLLPVRGKSCSTEQMPTLAKKFPTYASFADADVFEVVGRKEEIAVHLQVDDFRSGVFFADKKEGFQFHPFENKGQFAPVRGIVSLSSEKETMLITAGNLYEAEVETTRADAGFGYMLSVDRHRKYKTINRHDFGLMLSGNIKNLINIQLSDGSRGVVSAANDGAIMVHYIREK